MSLTSWIRRPDAPVVRALEVAAVMLASMVTHTAGEASPHGSTMMLLPAPMMAPAGAPTAGAGHPAIGAPTAALRPGPTLAPDTGRKVNAGLGGTGQAFRIESKILGQTRRIDIALPASFASSARERRYPVVVVFDGESHLAPVAAVSEELTQSGLIPEAVLVAIENEDPYRGRVHDLTPPGLSVSGSGLDEGGDRFLDFIEQELLPAVDLRFRGGPPRVMVGHSSGAILAIYAAATRPGFRAVVAVDAPVHLSDGWLAKKLAARTDATPLRFAYYEARFPWPQAQWDSLTRSAPASWKLHQERLTGEGHETAFLLGAYLGLREVFDEYSRFAAPVAPTTRILPYYERVSETFGAPLVPPQRVLRNVVEDLLMEGRGAAAHAAYTALVSGYGAPPDGADLARQITEVERQPPPTETVEGLLATPFPTPEEARPYLGEWIGRRWMTDEEPKTQVILRIRVVDGKVVAEMENPDAPEEFRIQKMEYLKVTPQGLSFGFMNGMRPRGLNLFEGTLKDDVLTGKLRWGGIRFTYPKGETPPNPGFSLRHAGS